MAPEGVAATARARHGSANTLAFCRRITPELMKFSTICLAASLAFATPAGANPAARAAVIDSVSHGVVSVRVEKPQDREPAASNREGEKFSRIIDALGRPRRQESGGTGFLIDDAGHIVTASFVLEGAQKVFITVPSGEERPATVVAVDEVSMVAVLRADSAGLAPLAFSKSAPKQGEDVYSIAYAFGLPSALATTGIVAGANVDFPKEGQRFLVLDMRINLGNAGAPVIDTAGRVVGMATAIYGSGAEPGSLGIAVPGVVVMHIAERLIRDGRIARSEIGVGASPSNWGAAGAVIERVDAGSPADRAGLKPGDIVFAADGESIADDRALGRHIAARPVGSVVTLGFRRNGEAREAVVTTVGQR